VSYVYEYEERILLTESERGRREIGHLTVDNMCRFVLIHITSVSAR